MSKQLEKLKKLLAELFQLDQADLDFGIYRIMNARREEITRFLEKDLLPQVKDVLALYEKESRTQIAQELQKAKEQAKALGFEDPAQAPVVMELQERYNKAFDPEAAENEIYSHLYNFFRRYYNEGDFISQRRYKEGVYAIPYEGEEVKLYWANHDQYYIKTSEYLRNYTFKLPSGKRVHFKLVDADTEKDNNRSLNGNERRFVYKGLITDAENNGDIVFQFEFRAVEDKKKQAELNTEAIQRMRSDISTLPTTEMHELMRPAPTEKNPNRTILEKHLNDFTARNTFDYFIHKDLGGFLRRELDFYIKNEVMYLDDIENETAPRVEQYLAKIKAIRRIAHKIIDFLAQIENYQKKLWLKKKFVVETHYCITIDRILKIDDADTRNYLLHQIASNDAQREEWVRLFAIDEIKGDLLTPAYSIPLTPEFLKAHPTLVVDTRHFDEAFKLRLLTAIPDIDEETDGLLIHSENFQALNLLQERYREQVKCIYIDPPYNTAASEILYKNEYKDSCWISLMADRIKDAISTLRFDGALIIAIDDTEIVNLSAFWDSYLQLYERNVVVINHHPAGAGLAGASISSTHEYALFFIPRSARFTLRLPSDTNVQEIGFIRTGTADSNLRIGRPNSFYAILVDEKTGQVVGAEPPPPIGAKYPIEPTREGFVRVYPTGADGRERVWRRSYESGLQEIQHGNLICKKSNGKFTIYLISERDSPWTPVRSNWTDTKYNAGVHGSGVLSEILGVAGHFSYPKSIYTVRDCVLAVTQEDQHALVLDFFAGSGTTGHAVINLNREDGGQRKFILVEMGEYFNTVLLPRIKKVIFTPEWKDGKPKRMATPEEVERSPRILKILRLESYEDTLNNLELKRTDVQQSVFDFRKDFYEDYMLRYMLDVESRGSASLLNIDYFVDPFSYKLNIATGTVGETKPVVVDLVETFNYLIGLRVKTIDHIAGVRVVTGLNAQDEHVLILWRNLKEMDNDKLDKWFIKQGYNTRDQEYDIIYVNGDNNLENLRKADQTWKVRMIEEEFKRLIFDVKDV